MACGRNDSGRITWFEAFALYEMGLGVVLYCCCDCWAAGLPIGMNMFCRLPTVTGDWVTFIGDET